jgi:hypothetical protein
MLKFYSTTTLPVHATFITNKKRGDGKGQTEKITGICRKKKKAEGCPTKVTALCLP